jgi:geranylgeranyl diphosphate synthase, type I
MTALDSLSHARARLLPLVERALQAALDRHLAPDGFRQRVARATHHLSPNAPAHYGMMRYHLGWVDEALQPTSGPTGKRLRPLICLIVAEACGGAPEVGLPAAIALELLHNFTLIHDDIEDGDAFRHHRPTVWKLWGEPQAINAGDGMHVLAHLSLLDLVRAGVPEPIVLHLAARLAETSLIITEGQHLDLAFERREHVDPDEYLDMIARKSAALLSCAAAMGAEVAGAPREVQQAAAAYGFDLGMGFQIRDDILGIWGEAETTGKPAGDLRRRKKTLPTLFALSRSDEAGREVLGSLFHSAQPSDAHVDAALAVLEQYGARQHCEASVATYSASARQHLQVLPESESRDALEALVFQLETREY